MSYPGSLAWLLIVQTLKKIRSESATKHTIDRHIDSTQNGQQMKLRIPKVKVLSLLAAGLLFIGCSNPEDLPDKPLIPLFAESEMSVIHGEAEKTWRITELINEFYDPNYDLEIDLSCVADDVYTFSSTREVSIDLGEDRCFGKNDNGIFKADTEIFDSELMYLGDEGDNGTIYLRLSRGYTNRDNTAAGITIRIYALAELSEDRMVFHREGGQYIGEYREAIVFERF